MAKSNREDFSIPIITALAKRAGMHCCFPNCPKITIGPSDESPSATSNTGMACHIYSASPNPPARRIYTGSDRSILSDISNGIWMCSYHGDIIDKDEVRFTVDMLKKWKEAGENAARINQESGIDFITAYRMSLNGLLANNSVEISNKDSVESQIGFMLEDSCIPIVWGSSLSDSIRDFLIEYSLNVFDKGSGKNISIEIIDDFIIVKSDSDEFNPSLLIYKETGKGGKKAIKTLFENFNSDVLFSYTRENGYNVLCISKPASIESVQKAMPCQIIIEKGIARIQNPIVQLNDSCNEVFVFLPPFFSYSFSGGLKSFLPSDSIGDRQIVFVVESKRISSGVENDLLTIFPDSVLLKV